MCTKEIDPDILWSSIGSVVVCICIQLLGGDPAADSPTATLLRLNPPCEAQIRIPHQEDPHPNLTQMV